MTTKEAQIALANLKRYISGGGAVDRGTNKAIDMAIKALEKPEPKKGRWIVKRDIKTGVAYGECSSCGMKNYAGHTNFCPNCGAKLKEGADG